ncbi:MULTISPECIES: serine/threonine-protein kinase [unclassified Streptomyces]|uniref:Serine/threonine-protein kinase n=1 Tax=Streptomyces sp. NBC_00119 TaxID=2975659 RepID=A0AAU1U7T4_9ACTN|nr:MULTISPECIES: serine/threonine-protein kinase [unclassified Streptomyces]MCX4642787.1 serine/threonine-protein kinase [Streptomyces sp. NBC_01446]MCX5323912.1 serine/threonine-protein kinase [Streptomyces sp. NBC_00120]
MTPLAIGDPLRLGPYRLLGVLGEGGMGKVYVGQDSAGAIAAVKVLRPELAHDTNLAQRFIREAQAAQAVHSKGVAAVLGAHTEGGRPWIATEFLAGPTLDQAVDAYGPFDEATVRAIADSVARTLADIHAAGFIHRDLKPPNIVLTSSGPRVIDFGIARPEHGLTLTTTGQTPVTPGYGAPEQVLGQRVAPSADVFSLGALLVYAASGRRAFDGAHVAAVQYEVVHGEPQLADLATQLQALIAPCLVKDPALRPAPAQIVTAFAAPRGAERVWRRGPVAGAIKEREGEVRQLTTQITSDGRRPVTRRRLITGFAAGGAVLAAGGGTTAWWLGSHQGNGKAKDDPFDIPVAVRPPIAQPVSVKVDKDFLGHEHPSSLWELANVVDISSPTLLPVRDVIVFGAMSGGITAYGVRRGEERWTAPHARAKSGYLSLSDRLVVTADADGKLRTYVPSTGQPKWTADAEADKLLCADDEAVYVLTKDDRLRSIGRSDARIRWTARVSADFRKKIDWPSAVGHGRLVLTTRDGNILAVNTDNGRQAWARLAGAPNTLRPVADGDTVYINGKTLSASRITDGEVKWKAKNTEWDDGPSLWGPPSVTEDSVYSAEDDTPNRFDKRTGEVSWFSPDVATNASPLLPQGTGVWVLYTESNAPSPLVEVHAMRQSDGKDMWTYTLPNADYHRLAADANRVFVMNDSTLTVLPVF